ncbi:hypothetical protein J3R82DRAFT_10466 [Butyriboletus roseoflavus]|nr:hypothetical protein J3R82DRAFT_10466 [Butyriboletus roseoflavus]
MSFKPRYTFPVKGRSFHIHIWDTIGLNGPGVGVNGYLSAIEQSFELIHHLRSQLTATTQSNYRLFYEVLCKSKVPVALVITHLEREANMEKWWEGNLENLEKHGIKAAGHACVTGLPTHSKYRESQHNIWGSLEGCSADGRYSMPTAGWLTEFLRSFGLFVPLNSSSKRTGIIKVLTKRCRMDPKIAEELAVKLEGA